MATTAEASYRSKFPNWNAEALIYKAASNYRSANQLANLISADWFSFSAEYVRAELKTTIPMTLSPGMGILGMNASYQESLKHQGEGFIKSLREQQKHISRAEIENHNLQKLNEWSRTAPAHSLFIWNSPPGAKVEGYGGKDSHSFTFVYEKTSQSEVVLHQFRSWMSLGEHLGLQTLIENPLGESENFLPQDHALIDHTTILHPPNNFTPSQSKHWVGSKIQNVEKYILSTAKNWRVSPSEIPQVPETEYQQFSDFLISLYIRKVVPLLLEKTPNVDVQENSQWENFVHSQAYITLVKELDLAFAYLAYQPLLKFVEQNNGVKNAEAQNFAALESNLLFLYQTKLKELEGKTVSRDDQQKFNQAGSALLSTSNLFSQGQCGIGALLNNQMSASAIQTSGMTNAASIKVPNLEAANLSQLEKQVFLEELREYQPLFIRNQDTGQIEIWYGKFITKDKNHVQTYTNNCYIKNDQVFGPCDEPLTPGSIPIKYVDEYIDMFSLMPEEEYLLSLDALEYAQSQEYFENEYPHQSLEEILLEQAEGEIEKDEIRQLIKTAESLISSKQVVGINELLAGEIYHPLLKGVINKLSKYAPYKFILKKLQESAKPSQNTTDITTAQAQLTTV